MLDYLLTISRIKVGRFNRLDLASYAKISFILSVKLMEFFNMLGAYLFAIGSPDNTTLSSS